MMSARIIRPVAETCWALNGAGIILGGVAISSNVTDTSKNALNSTGLLRHSTPITALKHYTRAQKESIEAYEAD